MLIYIKIWIVIYHKVSNNTCVLDHGDNQKILSDYNFIHSTIEWLEF